MKSLKEVILQELKTDDGFTSKEQNKINKFKSSLSQDQQNDLDNFFISIFGYSLSFLLNSPPNARKKAIILLKSNLKMSETKFNEVVLSYNKLQENVDPVFIYLCGWSFDSLLDKMQK